jgi:hypothetical protein
MAYRFRGFFSDGDVAVMEAALARWPFCKGKTIASPFNGFGLSAPDPDREAESDEENTRLPELPFAVERGLLEFSRGFSSSTFVFIDADCFGGVCIYSGFVARAGEVHLRVESEKPGLETLRQLLLCLGVRLQSGYFEPFVRGYWAVPDLPLDGQPTLFGAS